MPQSATCLNHLEQFDALCLELKSDLLRFLDSFDSQQPPAFCDIEAHIITSVRRMSAQAQATAISLYSLQLDALCFEGIRWIKCHKETPVKYHGLDGLIETKTQLYRHEDDPQRLLNPQALRAGLLLQKYTYLAGEVMLKAAADDTYRGACTLFESAHLIGVKSSQLQRDLVHIQQEVAPEFEQIVEHGIEALQVPEAATSISVMLDRVSVAMEEPKAKKVGRPKKHAAKTPVLRSFRMAYASVLTWHDEAGDALGSVRLAALPDQGDAIVADTRQALSKLIKHTDKPLKLVTLGDGAEEMQNKLREITQDFKVDMRLLDFWHAVEYLAPAINECEPDEFSSWFKLLKKGLMEGKNGVKTVLTHLKNMKEEHDGEKLPATNAAITYIENHIDLMNYAQAREMGLPVGSGVVEASCKTIVEVRMKRCGMRWKKPGAQGIMRLRAISTSAGSYWRGAYRRMAHCYVNHLDAA